MVYDAHCHLSPNCFDIDCDALSQSFLQKTNDNELDSVQQLALMSTNQYDADLVLCLAGLINVNDKKIIPCVGVHPWYAHLFLHNSSENQLNKEDHYKTIFKKDTLPQPFLDSLPDPISASEYFDQLHEKISGHNNVIVGEIGLDKLFRIPWAGFLGNQNVSPHLDQVTGKFCPGLGKNNMLSPYRVPMDHQLYLFTKALSLASKLQVPVSIHCVKAHGVLYSTVTEFLKNNCLDPSGDRNIPALCLHSYTGSLDQAKLWIKTHKGKSRTKVYFSFSDIINNGNEPGSNDKKEQENEKVKRRHLEFEQLIKTIPEDALLIETDLAIDRYYADNNVYNEETDDYENRCHFEDLKLIARRICSIRGWSKDEGIKILLQNWQTFVSLSKLKSLK